MYSPHVPEFLYFKWIAEIELQHQNCFANIFQTPGEEKTTDSAFGVDMENGKFRCFSGYCRQEFSSPSILLNHQFYAGHLDIYCCVCDKTFSRKDKLRRHVQSVHLQERFQCKLCPEKRAYNRKDKLNAHQLKTHGMVMCAKCGAGFSETKWLKDHVAKYHQLN